MTGSSAPVLALPLVARGKVREIYDAGTDRLLLVASDRISAYDWVLPTPIPDKGRMLTALSVWWFEQLAPVLDSFGASHHLISADRRTDRRGRAGDAGASAGRCCPWSASPAATCPARARVSTSGPARSATSRCRRGWSRARGCPRRSSPRRPRRRWGSTTRRSTSPTSRRRWVPGERPRCASSRWRCTGGRGAGRGGRDHPRRHEVRVRPGGRRRGLVLGDEVLTPDSSRFWPASSWSPGAAQPSYDKQYVRDWLVRVRLGPRLPAAGAAPRRRGRHP